MLNKNGLVVQRCVKRTHTHAQKESGREREHAHYFHHLASPDFLSAQYLLICLRSSVHTSAIRVCDFSVFNSFRSISIKLLFNGIKARFITNQ